MNTALTVILDWMEVIVVVCCTLIGVSVAGRVGRRWRRDRRKITDVSRVLTDEFVSEPHEDETSSTPTGTAGEERPALDAGTAQSSPDSGLAASSTKSIEEVDFETKRESDAGQSSTPPS